jgi:hypothetical protein
MKKYIVVRKGLFGKDVLLRGGARGVGNIRRRKTNN